MLYKTHTKPTIRKVHMKANTEKFIISMMKSPKPLECLHISPPLI